MLEVMLKAPEPRHLDLVLDGLDDISTMVSPLVQYKVLAVSLSMFNLRDCFSREL